MIPILYEKTEKSFTANGIGRLSDAISCVVTEVKNGEYTLEMQYPATGKHFDEIQEERIIYAKPNDGEGSQPFTIFRISKPIDGVVTVSAQHISYLLNKMIVMPFTADTCQDALSHIPSNTVGGTGFTFWTDKHVTAAFKNETPRGVRGLLGGEQGSILDVYGKGEYEFDHFAVKLHVNRGADYGVTLRYGKNITGLENTLDMSNVYTGIVPFWKSEDEILMLPEGVVWSNYTGLYAYNLVKTVDFTSEWQDKPSVVTLRERAQKYIRDNEGWILPQNINVSFVHLADTEEYKDIAPLERVRLCDTVTVIDTPLGVNIKATVIKTVYDTLLERYQSIEVGETRPNLRTVIEEQIRDPIIEQTSSRMQAAIQYATALITGGKGGFLIINQNDDGTPNELLIMNTPDKNTATQVLRINKNGIGFGKSYEGPFNTAWTLDGHFVANYIDTGTLNADLIRTGILRGYDNSRNYWNMQTGEFHMRSDGVSKGIDFENGVLYINADNITTGTLAANRVAAGDLRLDGAQITTGTLAAVRIPNLDASKIVSGTIDASKITVKNLNASNITTGQLSANRIKTGTLMSNDGHCSFNLDSAFIKVDSNDGTSAWLYDGYLLCQASGWQDVKIEANTSNFNNMLVRGALYARGGLTIGTSEDRKNLYTSGDAYIYGIISASYNITAGGEIAAGGVVRGQDFIRTSDRNRKKDIKKLSVKKAIDFIMSLIPRSYKLKKRPEEDHHGFIAQEVKEISDWAVYADYEDADGKTCGINYDEIIADLVAVVQDQQKRIEALEERVCSHR